MGMARVRLLESTDVPRRTRVWYWLSRRLFGRVLAPYRVAGHAPRMVPGLSLMSVFFGTGRWMIGPELRTLVHLRVAQIVGCVF
jgi:alkylhydroperoxidase family enzyme